MEGVYESILTAGLEVNSLSGERVACIVFDGLSVANAQRHGDEPLLAKCTAACEEVCPGINMGWDWKELDFEVRTKDTKKRVPDRAEGKVLIVDGKLCIPDDYEPPEPPDEEGEGEAGGGDGGIALDPRYEPTYDELARLSVDASAVRSTASSSTPKFEHAMPESVSETETLSVGIDTNE